ncbi:MAG: hypothetical protein IT243_10480 [Bacteroidia bacterium]|nr:hypothetical protein [Bacteroidia bacterium]
MGDSATIKRTDMKRTFLHRPSDLTARHDSQRKEVLFFADPHFLFFNFVAAAQVAHFILPLTHEPPQRQNKKSHFSHLDKTNKRIVWSPYQRLKIKDMVGKLKTIQSRRNNSNFFL